MRQHTATPNTCILCGSALGCDKPYLWSGGEHIIRDFAYLLPSWILRIAFAPNPTLRERARSVIVNKQYFGDRRWFWCDSCCTGVAWPLFDEAKLNNYYSEFYWQSREQRSAYFSNDSILPRESNLASAQEQLDWVDYHGVKFSTALDFGAGDCAGAYLMSKKCGLNNVLVVDSSNQTQIIAKAIGLRCSSSLKLVKPSDFIYSSHAIEHVADLICTFALLENAVCDGGFVFLDTPNVADRHVFGGLVMTPHTFLLSEASFEQLSKPSKLKLIAAETVGPKWSKNHHIASQARTDLRVLFKKISR